MAFVWGIAVAYLLGALVMYGAAFHGARENRLPGYTYWHDMAIAAVAGLMWPFVLGLFIAVGGKEMLCRFFERGWRLW